MNAKLKINKTQHNLLNQNQAIVWCSRFAHSIFGCGPKLTDAVASVFDRRDREFDTRNEGFGSGLPIYVVMLGKVAKKGGPAQQQ